MFLLVKSRNQDSRELTFVALVYSTAVVIKMKAENSVGRMMK